MFIGTHTGRALPFRTSDNGIVKKMDVEKTIEFLLSNQAKHDERLTRLETVVGSLAGSVDKLADNIERLDEAMVTLAESGVQRIGALTNSECALTSLSALWVR